MKIAVMGAGGVGGFFGARLAAAGNDVSFVARGSHLQALGTAGLRLVGPDEDNFIVVEATDNPAEIGPVDVVIFAVKLYDTEAAAEAIRPLVGPQTRVLTLQNGIDGGETLARTFGGHRIWAGPAYVTAHISEPGVIRYFAWEAKIRFGAWDLGTDDLCFAFADLCNAAGFAAEVVGDVREPLWTKFILLATNGPLSAAARLPVYDIYQDRDLRAVAVAAMREVEAVARSVGVPVADDVVDTSVAFSDTIPPGSRASICNDLLRGARIEIEGLSGLVCRLGEEHQVATPIHRTLYAILKPYRDGPPKAESPAPN